MAPRAAAWAAWAAWTCNIRPCRRNLQVLVTVKESGLRPALFLGALVQADGWRPNSRVTSRKFMSGSTRPYGFRCSQSQGTVVESTQKFGECGAQLFDATPRSQRARGSDRSSYRWQPNPSPGFGYSPYGIRIMFPPLRQRISFGPKIPHMHQNR
jgi:hypothetical protein